MYELKKNRKVFSSKFVGTGPSSYKKRIYRTAVSLRLRNATLEGCKIQPPMGVVAPGERKIYINALFVA